MKRSRPKWILSFFVLFSTFAFASEIKDNSTKNSESKTRIVSLAPSLTEFLFLLGLGPNIIGNTIYCDYPPQAKSIMKVGDFVSFDVEKILKLNPSHVVATNGNNLFQIQMIKKAGIPVVEYPFSRLFEIVPALQKMGKDFQKLEESQKWVKDFEHKKGFLLKKAEGKRRLNVLIVLQLHPLLVVGKSTFISDLFELANLKNIVNLDGYPSLEWGYLKSNAVDVVVFPVETTLVGDPLKAQEIKSLFHKKGVSNSKMRVVLWDQAELSRPGPRVVQVLDRLIRDF